MGQHMQRVKLKRVCSRFTFLNFSLHGHNAKKELKNRFWVRVGAYAAVRGGGVCQKHTDVTL